jgi:hypothetical protein
MIGSLKRVRGGLLGVATSLATLWLLIVARDYPCLQGAGLALADFEAFILSIAVALPCFLWAIIRLRRRSAGMTVPSWDIKWVDRLAMLVVTGSVLFIAVALPVVFSVTPHPLHFICKP